MKLTNKKRSKKINSAQYALILLEIFIDNLIDDFKPNKFAIDTRGIELYGREITHPSFVSANFKGRK